MKLLRIIVLLLTSVSLHGMDKGKLPSQIGSPARPDSQDASRSESPAAQRAHAELTGTPRSNALIKALAGLAFKPAKEDESPRSQQRAAAGTCMDKNLERKRSHNEAFDSDDSDSDSDGDENKPPQNKRRGLVFMSRHQQPNWKAKLAAAQQQQQQPQIDISTLEELAQPPMKDNSQVSTMRQEADARLKARKRANESFSDNDSDDDEYTPEQPAQKKPKRDEKPQDLPFREAAGQGQPAMDISALEAATEEAEPSMEIDSDDSDDL